MITEEMIDRKVEELKKLSAMDLFRVYNYVCCCSSKDLSEDVCLMHNFEMECEGLTYTEVAEHITGAHFDLMDTFFCKGSWCADNWESFDDVETLCEYIPLLEMAEYELEYPEDFNEDGSVAE